MVVRVVGRWNDLFEAVLGFYRLTDTRLPLSFKVLSSTTDFVVS